MEETGSTNCKSMKSSRVYFLHGLIMILHYKIENIVQMVMRPDAGISSVNQTYARQTKLYGPLRGVCVCMCVCLCVHFPSVNIV